MKSFLYLEAENGAPIEIVIESEGNRFEPQQEKKFFYLEEERVVYLLIKSFSTVLLDQNVKLMIKVALSFFFNRQEDGTLVS